MQEQVVVVDVVGEQEHHVALGADAADPDDLAAQSVNR
jgi:hypothetical protein